LTTRIFGNIPLIPPLHQVDVYSRSTQNSNFTHDFNAQSQEIIITSAYDVCGVSKVAVGMANLRYTHLDTRGDIGEDWFTI
jgi:hypothetical protein